MDFRKSLCATIRHHMVFLGVPLVKIKTYYAEHDWLYVQGFFETGQRIETPVCCSWLEAFNSADERSKPIICSLIGDSIVLNWISKSSPRGKEFINHIDEQLKILSPEHYRKHIKPFI